MLILKQFWASSNGQYLGMSVGTAMSVQKHQLQQQRQTGDIEGKH